MRVPYPFPDAGAVRLWLAKPPQTFVSYPLNGWTDNTVDVILDGSEDIGCSDFSFCTNRIVWINHDQGTKDRAIRLIRRLIGDWVKAPIRIFYEWGDQLVFWDKKSDKWTDAYGNKH